MKKTKLIALIVIAATAVTAHADDRKRHESKRHESHNYIIERQQAGSVSSGDVPIIRRIRGSREIDVYSDGSMFEKNNFVGYDKR
jgi:hypothetical protein